MLDDGGCPGDLTISQWRIVAPLLPRRSGRGPRPTDRKWVLDAILYVTVTGSQGRQLPHDCPHLKTVYSTFWKWRCDGVIQRVHDALREKARKAAGKQPTPPRRGSTAVASTLARVENNRATTWSRKSPIVGRT
ncbi:MAG: transposase [Pirellulales bacterium]